MDLTPRRAVQALAVVVVTGTILAVLDRAPPGPRSLAVFDPDRVADLELEMWKAYYGKDRARLFGLLVVTLREQYRLPWHGAVGSAFHLARAASKFASLKADYDSVLPDLRDGYAVISRWTGGSFDPARAAEAELDWWVARRTPGHDGPTEVGERIATEYAVLYGGICDSDAIAQAGLLRAEAAHLRDEEAEKPSWNRVGELLRRSYRTLRGGMAIACVGAPPVPDPA